MKRYGRVLICVLMVCLFFPGIGMAQTQEEWNLSCVYKLSVSSPVYSRTSGYGRDNPRGDYVTTLSANTYVKKGGGSGWVQVTWMSGGSTSSGYVWSEDLVRCASMVLVKDGDQEIMTDVSELDPNHDAIVNNNHVKELAPSLDAGDYSNVTYIKPTSYIDQAVQNATTEQEKWELHCSKKTTTSTTVYRSGNQNEVLMTIPAGTYFDITNSGTKWTGIEFMIDGTRYKGMIAGSSNYAETYTQVTGEDGMPDAVHELDPRYQAIVNGGGSGSNPSSSNPSAEPAVANGTSVSLLELGTVTAKVSSGGKTMEVPVADLVFAADIPEDKKMAVVYAPRTGKATLRSSASKDARAIKQCKAGTIVAVLGIGNTFTKVNYNGTAGYILTSCLQFHAPVEETQGNALISYNGKTNGSTTVNIRNQSEKDSAKVAVWKTGTEVIVLSHADGWYEIEAKGIRGFVMEEFVTVQQ